MNTPFDPSNAAEADLQPDDIRLLCACYLDGTLDPEQAARLESRFTEPEVARALEVESDWLLNVAEAIRIEGERSTSSAGLGTNSPAANGLALSASVRIFTITAALAATLLFAVMTSRRLPKHSIELELARSLAAPTMQWESEGVLFNEHFDELDAEAVPSEWEATDESLGWMLVAVEPILVNEDENDG